MIMESVIKKNSRLSASGEDSTKDSETSEKHVGIKVTAKKLNKNNEKTKLKDKNEVENSAKVSKKCLKKRNPYTIFVGNIPYKATKEEIKKHFEKAGEVVDIRVPTHKGTEKQKGFAYVEVKDRITYEKALSLHHSHLHGRKINVEYTTQGKKGGPKEEKIKQKNLKLRALSKIGILFPRKGLKGKPKVEPKSAWVVDEEKNNEIFFLADKMAISNAKRARNASEGEDKIVKKKKHSELTSKAVSSPKLTPNKKGAQVNMAQSKQQKAMKITPQGSSKKAKNLSAAKGAAKNQAKKGKTGKQSKDADSDEEDDDEEEESDDEDEEESEENVDMEAEESEEAGEDANEEQENQVAENEEEEADDDSESDDNEAEGAEGAEEGDSDDEENQGEGDDDEDDSDADESPPKKTPKKQDTRDDDKSDDFTAFVSNIPYSAGQEDLKKFFGAAGTVTSVRIPVDNKTGRPRGFVFVSFEDEDGLNAALEMDGEEMDGRALKIMKSHNSGKGERREGGFRGGRGFRGGDRRGGGFHSGGRGGGFRGDRRGGGGFRGGDRGGRGGGFRGGDRRGGGRSFRGGDKFGGGGGRPFRGGGGKPWQKDGGDRHQKHSGGDSD
ncbi:uncharacterized protein [Hetaerina americana]|uniref:uncharacterized protein n=1 Tax=Hetaerina americana TaxID=62018 RepID=UPI003A7F42A0